jgi:hypothetical protein
VLGQCCKLVASDTLNFELVKLNFDQNRTKRANPRREVCKKIFVGKCDPSTAESDLKEYFSKFGKVSRVVCNIYTLTCLSNRDEIRKSHRGPFIDAVNFRFIWPCGFRNRQTRNKNCLWQPC